MTSVPTLVAGVGETGRACKKRTEPGEKTKQEINQIVAVLEGGPLGAFCLCGRR